jgi:diacylglycerol kinase family enzyme
MKFLFLNLDSCGGNANPKWDSIKENFTDTLIVDDFYHYDWSANPLKENDILISAGGDGTLHLLVNTVIQKFGEAILDQVTFGHIGLGSNNSFLRPYDECQMMNNIPMKISQKTWHQDLMKFEIEDSLNQKKIIYATANSSMGFLAEANCIFNSSALVLVCKKLNSDLADIVAFFKCLLSWRSQLLTYEIDGKKNQEKITNIHLMKRKYYAAGLCFPEDIAPMNNTYRINKLAKRNPFEICFRFVLMLFLKQHRLGRDFSSEIQTFKAHSDIPFLVEIDGEIYKAKNICVTVANTKIKLCS